ncbi:uncharacterized protein LOC119589671 [Penaeus monodon]|uniref:uncharacterized protein LOC119589671 n=1 Tax=Penaeus monodon TaxID=6687 RepID=UPI0018A75D36|nr:uncharacterized protein LOC119589671 [Penaeus monodon]
MSKPVILVAPTLRSLSFWATTCKAGKRSSVVLGRESFPYILRRLIPEPGCVCVRPPPDYEAPGVLQPAKPRGLGKYENCLKGAGRRMTPPQDDPLDRRNVGDPDGFMPVTRKILFAVAKAEGRTVSEEELQRLDRAEKILPSAFKFMLQIQGSDFFGFENPDAERAPMEDADTSVSGSFVQMPHGRSVFIHHW